MAHHLGVQVQRSERIKITRLPSPQHKAGVVTRLNRSIPVERVSAYEAEDDHPKLLDQTGS